MSFQLSRGDLLFQHKKEDPVHEVISNTFDGIYGYKINHVAIYVETGMLIEAIEPQVAYLSLADFLKPSAVNLPEQPGVLVGRLLDKYQSLIPAAIEKAKECLGLPYNKDFGDQKDSYYCSELIVDIFRHANKGVFVFQETPMSFKNPANGQFFDYWIDYYQELGMDIPEGQPGSHPALLSLSDKINIVHQYQ